jgi:hypothetical protein
LTIERRRLAPGTKGQRRRVGDIVKIDQGDGFHSYARVLEEGLFAFYDSRTREDLSIDQILARAVLFIVPVMNHAVTRGRWRVMGNASLEEALKNPPPRFMQDALDPDLFRIYEKGKIRPASKEECVGLEREAAWDPTHIEDRLRDHYLGQPNKWVEALKIKSRPRKDLTGSS